jgi:hypothetical protein
VPYEPPRVAAALRTLLALAGGIALVLMACGDDAPAEPALSTVTAGGASQPALDGTTIADGTASAGGTVEPTASTGAIAVEELGIAQFTRADGSTIDLPLEVPPAEEYPIGLSGRYALEGRGMLFDYSGEEARDRPFWMKNTHVDLDIAFIAPDGRVGAIKQMTAESEEYVYSGIAYDRAIEAPVGWYEANGVAVGDAVVLQLD